MRLFDRFSKKNKPEEENPQEPSSLNQPNPEVTKQLLMDSLRNFGCQPDIDDSGNVFFRYQGESFLAIVAGKFIRIWDLPFMNVNVLDTRMPIFLEAINKANSEFGPSIVMRNPNNDGDRQIATRMDIIFIPQLSEIPQYLEYILSLFFDMKHHIILEIEKLTNNRHDNSQSSNLTSGNPSQN